MNNKASVFGGAAFILMIGLGSTPSLAGPRACSCKDLPMMVKEIIEQEYLGKLFEKWSGYMPREISSIGAMQTRAEADFNSHFYSKSSGGGAGTQDGGHAALGTMYESDDCAIGEYQYNKKGQPINKKGVAIDPNSDKPGGDNEQWVKPISEEKYINSGKQCDALVRYLWIHEQHHQKTCQSLKASDKTNKTNRTNLWKSLEFFAGNDAQAYKAGADYLREQAKELALVCGWEGSTGENAVPTPARAKELAQQAAKITKSRQRKASPGKPGKTTARIIVGPTAVEAPMDELISQWTTQCADAAAIGCGAIGASIEVELVNLIRGLQRSGSVDRQTLFDAAHADFPLLTQLAMSLMFNAQTPEEVEFALKMTEHPAAAVREAARRMLQGSDDSRWKPIERWWKSTRGADGGGPASGLVPDLEPLARYFGVETLEGLRHRPFGSDERSVMFTTTEPADVVVKRLSKGKTVMTKQSDMKKDMESFERAMMSMQKEMMAAAQSGDMGKIDKLTQKMMEMQEKLTGGDFAAINTDSDTEGILLEKDAKTGAPLSVARVKRDEEWGQTVVIFERNQPN